MDITMNRITVPTENETFWAGVKDCVPTLLGYWSIGFAAGVVQYTAGLSLAEIAATSLLLYAGSAQFIAAGMISTASPPAAVILTVLFVNLRHLLLSAALSPYFKHLTPLKNMLIGALLTDETFGVAIAKAAQNDRLAERWMHGLNLAAYLNWFAANIAGAVFGQWVADPQKYGLDFALPAMFIGLLVLSLAGRNNLKRDLAVAAVAGAVAVGLQFAGAGSFGVILATLTAATFGMVSEKWK